MITITKKQRDYLEEHGCTFPNDLHRTYGKHKKWYATENDKVKKLLEQMDKEIRNNNEKKNN